MGQSEARRKWMEISLRGVWLDKFKPCLAIYLYISTSIEAPQERAMKNMQGLDRLVDLANANEPNLEVGTMPSSVPSKISENKGRNKLFIQKRSRA